MQPRLALFGTPEHSLRVFEGLHKAGYPIAVVISKQPRLIGRKQILTPTPVAQWATHAQIPLLTFASDTHKPWLFEDESRIYEEVLAKKPELIITADYTQKIPSTLVSEIKFGALNVHPSLLPKYRGPAPIPWAILYNEKETGVSIVTLGEEFDAGLVVGQSKESILSTDTTELLLTRLFSKGAKLLIDILPTYLRHNQTTIAQTTSAPIQPSYFPRFTRNDGYIPYEIVKSALRGETIQEIYLKQWETVTICKIAIQTEADSAIKFSTFIERAWRALHPWPGIWTTVSNGRSQRRIKILSCHIEEPSTSNPLLILDTIQIEGKLPTSDQKYIGSLFT